MLITTGKNAGKLSKRIAAALCLAVQESRFEPRGKRTVQQLIAKAAKLHFSRLCSIYEESGRPSQLSFLAIDPNGGWTRLSPSIKLKNIPIPPKKTRGQQSASLVISGTKKKVLQKLLNPLPPKEEPDSSISASGKKIEVKIGRKKILSIGVSYEK